MPRSAAGQEDVMRWTMFAVLALLAMPWTARAQGVTASEIVIGQTSSFSGAIGGEVREQTAGAKLYLDWVNAHGGVYGRKIRLVSLDDGFDPKRSAQNARTLIAQGVFALFLTRGTPQNEAILPVVNESGTPLIAPSTGASVVHEPVNRLVFNVRTRYQTEAEDAIEQLTSQGITRIAIVHVNDSFGKDCLAGYLRGLKDAHLEPVGIFSYDRKKGDTNDAAAKVIALAPQAIVTAGPSKPLANLVRKVRGAGLTGTQIVTLSNLSSQSFLKDLGDVKRGMIVMQVFPNPARMTTRLGVELHHLSAGHPDFVISHMAMEGFAAAKVLVEGLRRAGRNPTRASFLAAMDTLRDYDLGGVKLTYAANDHSGLDYVEASMVNKQGTFTQ
jgi:ABC-type branched-subunit amino acid transport system substrate-binding protein